jgi:hypothetical protein
MNRKLISKRAKTGFFSEMGTGEQSSMNVLESQK